MKYFYLFLIVSFINFVPLKAFSKDKAHKKNYFIHRVKLDESLMTISYKYYGTHQKWRLIAAANKGIDFNTIEIGQEINIPKNASFRKKVKRKTHKKKTKISKHKKKSKIKKAKMPKTSISKEDYLDEKKRRQEIQAKYLKLKEKFETVKNWDREKKEVLWELKDKTNKLNKTERKVANLQGKIVSMNPSILAYSEDQVLREKNRILMQKIWVEKNRNFQECKIQYANNEVKDKDLHDFITFLNESFGNENVLFESSENKIIVELSGRTVYGVDSPKINSKFFKQLNDLKKNSKKLPIQNIHLTGISKFKTVKNESGKTVTGDVFMLKQSIALTKFFNEELNFGKDVLTSGSFGRIKKKGQARKKRFFMEISLDKLALKKKEKNSRSIASIVKQDKALSQLADQILEKLHEPKYSKVNIKDNALEIHLARQYFFKRGSHKLTKSGEKKIKSIFDMFSLVNDSNFQIVWADGKLEKDTLKNVQRGIASLSSIKEFADEKYSWTKNRIEIAYQGRHKPLKDAFTKKDDLYNKRIVFKVIPRSINVNILGEPVDEN